MKRLSLIAMAVATALVGCGGDDSSSSSNTAQKAEKPVIAIPAQGKFIDATIEGLYYISGEKQDFTNADGQYDIDTKTANVTFILGGEINGDVDGLVIGNVSSRHITTPFEAAGTFQRSVNLARLLLTINDNANDQLIVIPDAIKSPDVAMVSALKRVTLDDIDNSSATLLALLGKTGALVSAEQAQQHLGESLSELKRGSTDKLTHWSKGSNWVFVERSADQRVRNTAGSEFQWVIHADRTLGDEVFTKTVGLAATTFTAANNHLLVHKGSNDSGISGAFAAQYLTCVKENGTFSWSGSEDNKKPLCNDTEIAVAPELNDVASGNGHYQLSVTDPVEVSTVDKTWSWAEMKEMGGAFACMANANCTEQTLTKFEIVVRDDSDKQDDSKMQEETLSGSYDPITDVYVQTRSKKYLAQSPYPGRISEHTSFIYPVEAVGQDRYVDFIGTWRSVMTEPGCAEVAVATYTFDANGLTTTGKELNGNSSGCYLADLNETVSYQELANMDYWWFTTNAAGASKATLDQLNTTIRWNDRDEGDTVDNFKINRFSYIPAGKNWDRGVLVRDTLNRDGDKVHTQTLRKIK